jgi:hypothetical protein
MFSDVLFERIFAVWRTGDLLGHPIKYILYIILYIIYRSLAGPPARNRALNQFGLVLEQLVKLVEISNSHRRPVKGDLPG